MSRNPVARFAALSALTAAAIILTADISQACHHRRRCGCYSSCSTSCSSCDTGCSSCNSGCTSCTSTESSQAYNSNQYNSQDYAGNTNSGSVRVRRDYNNLDRGDRTARREDNRSENTRSNNGRTDNANENVNNGAANNPPAAPSAPTENGRNFDQPATANPAIGNQAPGQNR